MKRTHGSGLRDTASEIGSQSDRGELPSHQSDLAGSLRAGRWINSADRRHPFLSNCVDSRRGVPNSFL